MSVKISAVICTYNRPAFLAKAVATLRAQTLSRDGFDIWVIDNSPAGAVRNACAKEHADVNYITVDEPGLSNARNVALQRSTAPYVAFLDDDAVAAPNWLEEILKTFESDEKAAVVGGTILPQFEVPRPAWLHDKLLSYLSVVDYGGVRRRITPQGIETIAGASIAFHRQRALDAGAFNVALGRKGGGGNLLSGEETALVTTLLGNGQHVWYVPEAVVYHHIPAERLTRPWFRRRAAWHSVTEQMEGDLAVGRAIEYWQTVIAYMNHVPPEHRQFFGLLWDVDNPALFYTQVMAMRAFVRLMLGHGGSPQDLLQ